MTDLICVLHCLPLSDFLFRAVEDSGVMLDLISALIPDHEFGFGPAIECAWCLHYLVSRCGRNSNSVNGVSVLNVCVVIFRQHDFSFELIVQFSSRFIVIVIYCQRNVVPNKTVVLYIYRHT